MGRTEFPRRWRLMVFPDLDEWYLLPQFVWFKKGLHEIADFQVGVRILCLFVTLYRVKK